MHRAPPSEARALSRRRARLPTARGGTECRAPWGLYSETATRGAPAQSRSSRTRARRAPRSGEPARSPRRTRSCAGVGSGHRRRGARQRRRRAAGWAPAIRRAGVERSWGRGGRAHAGGEADALVGWCSGRRRGAERAVEGGLCIFKAPRRGGLDNTRVRSCAKCDCKHLRHPTTAPDAATMHKLRPCAQCLRTSTRAVHETDAVPASTPAIIRAPPQGFMACRRPPHTRLSSPSDRRSASCCRPNASARVFADIRAARIVWPCKAVRRATSPCSALSPRSASVEPRRSATLTHTLQHGHRLRLGCHHDCLPKSPTYVYSTNESCAPTRFPRNETYCKNTKLTAYLVNLPKLRAV